MAPWVKLLKNTIISIALLGVTLGLWAFWYEPASLTTAEYKIGLANWPASCSHYKIAVLADLHVGSPFNGLDKLDKIINETLDAKPDLVLLAGDFVIHGVIGGSFVPPEQAAASLSRLTSVADVYAVLGNHDWWLDGKRVHAALENQGIPVLEDASTKIGTDKCQFWLAGVSDYWEGAHDVAKALHNIPTQSPTIVFTHNPDVFPDIPSHVSLTIAGHTHGGQVYIPGIGRPQVPSQYGEKYAVGHIIEQGKNLFVNVGVGTSILPVRFLVPPEISILVLNRSE